MKEKGILLDVGSKLRAMRQQRGLSIRDLANACDLSANTISLIERGQMAPSIVTLQKLAMALEVKISFFFEEPADKGVSFVKANQRDQVRSDGILMENLGTGLADQTMELIFLQLDVKAKSGTKRASHSGHEFIFCLEGEIDCEVNGRRYLLQKGDSILFEAQLSHRWHNAGNSEAAAIYVLQTTEDRTESLNHHLATTKSRQAIQKRGERPARVRAGN